MKNAMTLVSCGLVVETLERERFYQVHNALVLEESDAESSLGREKLPKLMAGVAKLSVPLVAEVGMGRIGMRRIEECICLGGVLYSYFVRCEINKQIVI